ncbi:hypothetical protein ACHWQZ_G009114 [Mnemiopsis leidyi]
MELKVEDTSDLDGSLSDLPVIRPETVATEQHFLSNFNARPSFFRHKKVVRKDGYYITDTFYRRECIKFVAKSATATDFCKCGLADSDHSDDAKNWSHSHTADWNPVTDTIRKPTNAYGEIDFLHAENDVLPLYLRCDMEVDVADLGTLLLDKWAMPLPNLLISVFGGHSKFDSKKIVAESVIKEGLVKAARDTKAWLFTSGVNHGVSNLVGDAVAMKRSFVNSIPVIGVNSWGAVSNSNELVEEKEQGLFPAKYNAVAQVDLERDPSTGKPKSMSLEHEHTHFLLVDFGTRNNFHENDIRKFRIDLQQYLVERTQAQLVSVLIEGGSGSLEEAQIRVRAGLPVVIIADSGRISNVLSLAVDLAKEEQVCDGFGTRTERKLQNDDDRMKVRQALTAALPRLDEDKYDELMGVVEDVILKDELVTVWRCGKGAELDTTILEALIKSISNSQPAISQDDIEQSGNNREEREAQRERAKELMKRQLELAIQWDRLDIATEYIFENKTNNASMDLHLTESELNEMLNLAIKHKQIRFIRNIIERNANIKTFLTVERFEEILRENTPSNCLFYELMIKKSKSADPQKWTFEHFEGVVHDISEGVFHVPGKTRPNQENQEDSYPPGNGILLESIKICGKGGRNGRNYEPVDNLNRDPRSMRFDFVDPASLLTVYMALIHEQEMAKVIWEFSNTPLFLGLVCKCIHEWMAAQEKETLLISDAMAERLSGYGEEFEEITQKVLEEVSEYKIEHVIALINFKFENWGGKTILEMADYVDATKIIALSTIQDYIDVEWNGWLDSDMSTARLILSIFCPLLASFRDVTPFDKWKQKNLQTKKQRCRDSRQAFIEKGVGPEENDANEKLGLWTKCRYFYKAPITKFTIYTIVYGAFLFAYVCALLLSDRQDTNAEKCGGFRSMFGCKLTLAQAFVYIWVLCLIPLEIRQIYFSYPATIVGKLKMYWSNVYNKNDVVCILIIITALIFRLTDKSHNDITVSGNIFRILFSFAFILYCLKLCQALQISEQLGPKVMMMTKMLIDLQFFIFLVLIFVIGYGVSTASIMNPMKFAKVDSGMWFDIFWRPYTNLFGEIGEETIDEVMNRQYCHYYGRPHDECENDEQPFSCYDYAEDNTCLINIYIVKILLGLYMMLAAVLMLNLLVAVFSSTYEEIRENSKTLWKRQKFDLMVEYRSRSPLPVPLSTGLHCFRFLKLIFRQTCGRLSGCCVKDPADSVPTVDVHQRLTITLLEVECRRNYLDKLKVMSDQEVLQCEISNLSEDVLKIEKRLGDFESKIQLVIDVATGSRRSLTRGSPSDDSSDEESDEDMSPKLELAVAEVNSSEDLIVTAEEAASDMAVVETDTVPVAWSGSEKKKEPAASTNLKPMDPQRLQRLLKMGKKSRKPEYPGETPVRRAYVKKEYWDWTKIWIHYEPVNYTDVRVSPELKLPEIRWHSNINGDERRSYEGRYEIRNQLPLIPCGRTGLGGRGLLDKYGPNHAALPIITRLAKDDKGEDVILAGKPVFEVLLEYRGEVGTLPEVKGVYDEPLPTEIRQLLTKTEHLVSTDELSADKLTKRIDKIFKAGILVYRGFLDSEYNTDNSWLEAIIVSYHDSNDNAFRHLAFPENSNFRWSRITNWTNINTLYREYLQRAFYARNAYDHVTLPSGSSLHSMGS